MSQRADRTDTRSGMNLLFLHGACFLLVVGYVNMFQFWSWLSRVMGPGLLAKMLPIIVTLIVLAVISLRFIHRVNRGYRIRFAFVALGIVGAFLALAIPDPSYPIKRVHVAEYIVLSFLVRSILITRLDGMNLLFFTALVTALYGVHDEMLQGLHSLRYYGWRDMIVNGMAGLSGAMLGHGLVSFEKIEAGSRPQRDQSVSAGQAALFVLLLAAMVGLVVYIYRHRGGIFFWPSLVPVVASSMAIAFLYPETVFGSEKHHGLQAVFWLVLGTVFYPVIAALGGLEFL